MADRAIRIQTGELDELRARTPLAPLIARHVKLVRSGREWLGCCPFHSERTPSFHVYADHFHCFGCGAHGDAIDFLAKNQGLSFHDAVCELRAEAGLGASPPRTTRASAPSPRAVQSPPTAGENLEFAASIFKEAGSPFGNICEA